MFESMNYMIYSNVVTQFEFMQKLGVLPGSLFGFFSAVGSAAACSDDGSGSAEAGSGSEAGVFAFWLTDDALTSWADGGPLCKSGKFRHVAFNFLGLHPKPTHDVPFTTATISISFLSFNIRQ